MKILIVISGFYPAKNYGGPVVSIENFTSLLGKNYDCYILTRDCEFGTNNRLKGIKKGWNDAFSAKVMYVDRKEYKSSLFEKVVDEVKPDLIYLNSFFSYDILLPFIDISKKTNIPLLLAPRGELCENAFRMKKAKKVIYSRVLKLFLRNCDVFYQSTSKDESDALVKILGIKRSRIFELRNIPTVDRVKNKIKKKKSGSLNAIFVSRIHPKKNLLFVIECLKYVEGNVNLDVYGPKEDIVYWNKIEKSISHLPDNIKVSYCGNLDHDEIISTMSRYDCLLFYTLSENYGHVIAEAVNALCIPVLSDKTPWSDVKDYGAGFVSELKNEKECINNIQKIVDLDNDGYELYINELKKYRNIKTDLGKIKGEYLACLNTILDGEKRSEYYGKE